MKNHSAVAMAAAFVAFCLAGCASSKPITASSETLSAYQGQPLTVVTYNPKKGFFQITAGAAMFGAIGAVAALAESEKLIARYDLTNPSVRTAETLTPALSDRLRPSTVTPLADPSDGKDAKQLAALAGNKGLVLDVQALAWTSSYYPVNWSHYRPVYVGVSHLIDAGTGKLIAQGPCKIDSFDDKGAPTYDEMYADNAAILKTQFQQAADECASQMTKGLFGN